MKSSFNIQSTLKSLETSPVAVLSQEDLDHLLQQGTLLKEEDTHMSGFIRILDWQGTILLQEKTNRDEYTVRKLDSRETANAFLQNRLETYERMWDG